MCSNVCAAKQPAHRVGKKKLSLYQEPISAAYTIFLFKRVREDRFLADSNPKEFMLTLAFAIDPI